MALRHRVRRTHFTRTHKRVLREEKFRGRFDSFSRQRGGFLHRVSDLRVRVRQAAEEDFEGGNETSSAERR